MSGRKHELSELAALLDGEVKDHRQAEELYSQIQADSELAAEFELQREVKTLLAQLPQYSAPDFAATRVLGEIAARRGMQGSLRKRTWTAALAGFGVCLVAVVAAGALFMPRNTVTYAELPDRGRLVQPGLFEDSSVVYASQGWKSVEIPEELNAEVKDFLEFAKQAHTYSLMTHSANAVTPDLPQAIQVLDTGGER